MAWIFGRLRRHRLDRDAAERLLAGEPAGPDHADLHRLLSAAAGPGHPDELAGEKRARAAFRAARKGQARELALRSGAFAAPVPRTQGRRLAAAQGRRLAAAKVAAAVAVLLTAGTAVAAGTGRLPDPVQQRVHDYFAAVPEPSSEDNPSAAGTAPPTAAPATPTTPPPAPTAATPPPAPTAAGAELVRLCRAWLASEADPSAPKVRGNDLATLVRAAHGRSRVTAYCGQLVGSPAAPASSPTPTDKPKKDKDKKDKGTG